MTPKKSRKIMNGATYVAVAVYFLSYIPGLAFIRRELIIGAAILWSINLIFALVFLRCPHCKKLLNFRWSSQSICHNCGGRLDEENIDAFSKKQ